MELSKTKVAGIALAIAAVAVVYQVRGSGPKSTPETDSESATND